MHAPVAAHHRRVRFGVPVLAIVAATFLTALPAAAVPSGWTAASRAYATHSVVNHDLAVETAGAVHIATEGGGSSGIWYVTRVGSAWQKTHITTADDRSPSIALDGTGVVIAFARMDAADRGIFTASNVTGDWVVTKRHTGADSSPSVAVFDGRAHIAFQAPGGALRYLAGPDDAQTGWISEVVDGTCCTSAPSLALTSAGDPRVAYSDGTSASPGGLSVASRSGGGSWSRSVADTHRISAPALAVYGTTLHVGFVRRGAGTWYASKATGGWSLKQIDAGANGPPDLSAFSGSTAFIYGNTGKLKYATLSGGILFSKAFSSTKGDRRPRIVRAGGKPVVSFLRVNGGPSDGVLMSRQN